MTGTDLCVNKPHCAAAVRPGESEATTSTLPPARVREVRWRLTRASKCLSIMVTKKKKNQSRSYLNHLVVCMSSFRWTCCFYYLNWCSRWRFIWNVISYAPDYIAFYPRLKSRVSNHTDCLHGLCLTFWRRELFFFLILAHPVYKTWIKKEPNNVRIMKQTAFCSGKNGEYIPCLKYLVPVFVE